MNHLNTHKHLLKTLKNSINSWDFSNPDWNNLPMGFLSEPEGSMSRWPNLSKTGLTKEERHLFDAIKTQWIIEGGGREKFYKTAVRQVILGLTVSILGVLLFSNLNTSPDKNLTRSVSAKTVSQSFGDFVEATMSAVFRK
jgi:hypothetical protein